MNYRQKRHELLDTLEAWDQLIPGKQKVHLIACGGTALTLLGYKESTKDVDFLVPDEGEYRNLIRFLENAGYKNVTSFGWRRPNEAIIYDLFPGRTVYCTELLDSPLLDRRHRKSVEWNKIYVGILNSIDLIISKMFRGSQVDYEDVFTLFDHEDINIKELEKRFRETASFDVSENKALKHLERLLKELKKR